MLKIILSNAPILLRRLVDNVSLIDFTVEFEYTALTPSGLLGEGVVELRSADVLFTSADVLIPSADVLLTAGATVVVFNISIFSRVELTAASTVKDGLVSYVILLQSTSRYN